VRRRWFKPTQAHQSSTEMPFFSYILRSKASGRFYVGYTENLTKRIFEHNNNRMLSIKPNAERAAEGLWRLVAPWFHG
jgi:GIY-YIG catalytic domain